MKVYDKEAQQGKSHCNEFVPLCEYIMFLFSYYFLNSTIERFVFLLLVKIKGRGRQMLLHIAEEMPLTYGI